MGTKPAKHMGQARPPSSSPLVAFYLGQSTDDAGRKIDEIWAWNDQMLEYTHNYIQWLFPLRERSRFQPDAPLLTEAVIEEFRATELLRQRLLLSFKVMLRFYGFQYRELPAADIEIAKSPEYGSRKRVWLNAGNHNYLRLTRILTSLQCLGLGKQAQALLRCLGQIYQEEGKAIGPTTLGYWQRAVGSP